MFVRGPWRNRHEGTEIRPSSWYTADGTQHARGRFLILASTDRVRIALDPEGPEDGRRCEVLYAAVRTVSMASFGNWMMGLARIGGKSVTLSGSYGADGLTLSFDTLPDATRRQFVRLSDDETRAFWRGEGGHNSAGSEAAAMRAVAARLQEKGQS